MGRRVVRSRRGVSMVGASEEAIIIDIACVLGAWEYEIERLGVIDEEWKFKSFYVLHF